MTDVQYQKLKEQHDAAQEAASEAKGALKNLQGRLRTEFGLKTVEEAKRKLGQLIIQKGKEEAALNKAVAKYQKEFPE